MEELSPIYDNVSIREWANTIRQIKIRELEEYIKTIKIYSGTNFHDKWMNIMRITELEGKLEALKNAK